MGGHPVLAILAPSIVPDHESSPPATRARACRGNIWHSWNEGLMGTFQTLRELGYLPLVQIDDQGYMR